MGASHCWFCVVSSIHRLPRKLIVMLKYGIFKYIMWSVRRMCLPQYINMSSGILFVTSQCWLSLCRVGHIPLLNHPGQVNVKNCQLGKVISFWVIYNLYRGIEKWKFWKLGMWKYFNSWSPGNGQVPSVNSLRPSDAYMRWWNIPSLVQIMACRLISAKPLSEPIRLYC